MRLAHRCLLGTLAIAALLTVAADPAHAQRSSDALQGIREQILHARYEEAIAGAQELLQRQDLSALDRNSALEVLATAYLATRNEEGADQVLAELYRRDPGHIIQDPDASPVVQGAFQRARSRTSERINVYLEHQPNNPVERVSPLIELRVADGASAVSELRVHYRAAGAPRYAVAVMDRAAGDMASARLPLLGTGDSPQRIEYYIVAYAPSQTPLIALGSEAEPMTIEVPAAGERRGATIPGGALEDETAEEEESSSKWWVALIVVGVAGAAVGGYFLFRGEEPTGSLGAVSLQ